MKPTLLGRLVALAALVLFSIAFILGTLAPAIAAVVLLAFRDAASRGVQAGEITATRHAPPVVGVGTPFTVEIEARAEALLPIAIRDEDGHHAISSHGGSGRGEAMLVRELVADTPGRIEWSDTVVEVNDNWGLWSTDHHVDAPGSTRVAPEGHHLEAGRRAGKRNVVQTAVRDPHAASRGEEFRQVRPMMPGDSARDIDWRLTTLFGEPHSRVRERSGPRRIIILLDATRSMRRPARIPKIRSATNVALGVAGAAVGAGVSASLVAFHEEGVYTAANASTAGALQGIVQGLAGLPTVEGAEGFRLTTDLDRTVTADERRFLHNVALMSSVTVPATPSLDQALRALADMSSGPAFVVMITDGEVNPRRAEVAAERLQTMGHRVVVVVPATGPHHCTKQDAPIEDLKEAMARRKYLAHTLATRKAPMLLLYPDGEADVVKEVSRFAV